LLDTGTGVRLTARELELQTLARTVYEERISEGVAREQARKDLPFSTYTEAYWKIDLHNLFHFLQLRMDAHAQDEIRAYAKTIGEEIVQKWCPLAWAAFVDFRVNAMTLSGIELELVQALAQGNDTRALAVAHQAGWLPAGGGARPKNRERDEAEAKLTSLGYSVPWSPPSAET
jgi:thymidylate synthase (FAD)